MIRREYAPNPRSNLGFGRSLSQEQGAKLADVSVDFPAFDKGVDLRDAEQDQDASVTHETYDVEITDKNRLRRGPGHLLVETLTTHFPKSMFVHTSLDFTAELVFIDGVNIGIKGGGATVWTGASLPVGDEWVGISNLDNFLFTNGTTGIYKRAFGGGGTVTLITDSLPAATLANFAARVFAGAVTFDPGGYQALSVAWSADAEGDDWVGAGSGATLLISNNTTDDRVVAMRPMGFDILAVFCQKSIWIGRQTGDVDEPAIFEPRVTGVGCIAEPTCKNTPAGVMFLGESGVYVFDGNQETLLSAQINDELLPVLINVNDAYSAVYEQVSSRYWLFTPTTTWVYELKYNRWLRFNTMITRAVAYSEQFSGVSWDTVLASWNAISDAWEDLAPAAGQERLVLLFEDKLGIPVRSEHYYLNGTPVEARYGFVRRDTPYVNSLFTTKRVKMRHIGEEAILGIWFPDNAGAFVQHVVKMIPELTTESGVEIGVMHTGQGTGAQLRWVDPGFEISKVELVGLMRSAKRGVL